MRPHTQNHKHPQHKKIKGYELANTFPHGLGLLFGIIAIPLLVGMAASKGDVSAMWGTFARIGI